MRRVRVRNFNFVFWNPPLSSSPPYDRYPNLFLKAAFPRHLHESALPEIFLAPMPRCMADTHQGLQFIFADWRDKTSRGSELIQQRERDSRHRRGHHDHVERRLFRPSVGTIARAKENVAQPHRVQDHARTIVQMRVELD